MEKEELKNDTAEHSNPENETKIDDLKEGVEEKEEVIKNKTPDSFSKTIYDNIL